MISQYELNPALPIIIIGMPQLFEHNLLSYDDHMAVINVICDGAYQENGGNLNPGSAVWLISKDIGEVYARSGY